MSETNQMEDKLQCIGCGAFIQTNNPDELAIRLLLL